MKYRMSVTLFLIAAALVFLATFGTTAYAAVKHIEFTVQGCG
jgi:hypothetical protein